MAKKILKERRWDKALADIDGNTATMPTTLRQMMAMTAVPKCPMITSALSKSVPIAAQFSNKTNIEYTMPSIKLAAELRHGLM
jgi:hypothetical protein